MLDRRDLLKLALLVPACGKDFVEVCGGATTNAFDTVLDRLHTTDMEFSGGLSNHGPMATEVLLHVGREDRICDWAGHYVPILNAAPAAGAPIAAADQVAQLGNYDRRADWLATFLAGADLATVLPQLLPGMMALHGILRTGHALRAIAAASTPARQAELAHGLAYWAARFERVPGDPGSQPEPARDLVTALDQLAIVPESKQVDGGLIKDRLVPLASLPSFATDIARVDLDVWPIERSITELAAVAARLYIADAGRGDLGLLHAFDVTSILRVFLPSLDAASQRAALGYAFQVVAALHATHSPRAGLPPGPYNAATTADAVAEIGADADDEHTIKFTEALLREHAIDPRPEFLAAADLRI
ncbi:MAG TPA: hypothetical protein VMZ53_06325 [Kofleriaceae bacterium]|nr:hypothetical protein [Kofleriaceae bacterium]